MRRRPTAAVLALTMALLCGLLAAITATAPASRAQAAVTPVARALAPAVPKPKAKPAMQRVVRNVRVPAGDEIVTGRGDQDGWHIYAASSGGGWRWQPLASLQPGGVGDERWIGQQCLTGDGRFVVAVVAPWHAQNDEGGRDRGAFAYVVDAHSGAVRPLLAGVSLAYFDPGCGVGGRVALTRFLGSDQQATQVTVADAATGTVAWRRQLTGELTSAVPAGDGGQVIAARGGAVEQFGPAGLPAIVGRVAGQAFDLRPDDSGGVDLLAARPGDHTAAAWRLAGHALMRLGSGTLGTVKLFVGRAGHNAMTGASSTAGGAVSGGLRALASATDTATSKAAASAAEAASLDGGAVLLSGATTTGTVTGVGPRLLAPGLPTEVAAPARALPTAAAVPAANFTTPKCAVPRNDPARQVPQPTAEQVQWAVQEAVHGNLTGQNGRPAGAFNLGLPAYDPSRDFPVSLQVPMQVVEAVLAQESNWAQASWHALPGLAGNPLISDYYGLRNSSGSTIDYDQADCGYGLGQLTDIMTVGAPGVSPATQAKIAVDYEENIAATVQAIAGKWNQLASLGITMNDGQPSHLENWYFAAWAYNSGIHAPDPDGHYGLGWANNPVNPAYPPDRGPFLHDDAGFGLSYGDADHPQDWAYQEKVMGWMEVPLHQPDGSDAYTGTTKQGLYHDYLPRPPLNALCDASNNCDPSYLVCVSIDGQNCAVTGQVSDPCQLNPGDGTPDAEQYHCWWHQHINDEECPGHAEETFGFPPICGMDGWDDLLFPGSEPAAQNPHPPYCGGGVPADAIIVDEEPTGLNLAGCPESPTQWVNRGNFTVQYGTSIPDGAPIGEIDFHQLGAGFGGHLWFTHTYQPGDLQDDVVGTWTPSPGALVPGRYQIEVFVPDTAAAADQAPYTVFTGNGRSVTTTLSQASYGNQWVSIGDYWLQPGASVQLDNRTADGNGISDVAYNAVAFVPETPGVYVSMGDSYSAGEGAPAGPAGYDVGTDDQYDKCHRSPNAYGRQFATLTATYNTGLTNETMKHVACSGAGIQDFYTPYAQNHQKTYPLNPEASQLNQLAGIQANSDVGLITVTISGNDVGFADVLKTCITNYWIPGSGSCKDYYTQNNPNNLDTQIDNLLEEKIQTPLGVTDNLSYLPGLLSDIKATAPHAAIWILTYPKIFDGSCPLNLGNDSGGAAIKASDADWLNQVTGHLDDTIITAAEQVGGVQVLDERDAFAGHEICTSDAWVNGYLWQGNIFNYLPESFHPTTDGYQHEAGEMLASLNVP